jgi:hypothetical protein
MVFRVVHKLPIRVDPVVDLLEIGQFADASRNQLLQLTWWLAPSLRSCKDDNVVMVDRGPLTWAPVSLSTDRVVFDTSCLGTETEHHAVWTVIHTDSVTSIEREGNLAGLVSQGRFRLLEAECTCRGIPIEYLCKSILEWIAHVENVETTRGFGSHQFWNKLRIAPSLDSIVGCCLLMAPSSFPYASLTGLSPDWGSQQRPSRPILSLLVAKAAAVSLSSRLRPDEVWFTLSRRSTLDRHVKQLLKRAGQVITAYKRGSQVAASKGSFRSGKLKAIQCKEDLVK